MERLEFMNKQQIKELNASVLNIQKRLNKRQPQGNYNDQYWNLMHELKTECREILRTPDIMQKLTKKGIIALCALQSRLQFTEHHRFLLKFSKH